MRSTGLGRLSKCVKIPHLSQKMLLHEEKPLSSREIKIGAENRDILKDALWNLYSPHSKDCLANHSPPANSLTPLGNSLSSPLYSISFIPCEHLSISTHHLLPNYLFPAFDLCDKASFYGKLIQKVNIKRSLFRLCENPYSLH